MILEDKMAKLKWNSANKKRYVDLGYEFTAYKEEFYVRIEDLTPTTRTLVFVRCDYCEADIGEKMYKVYMQGRNRAISKKDSCVNCRSARLKESVRLKYGVDTMHQVESITDKMKETLLKNYGVDHISKSPEIREKVKETNLKKYGAENVFGSEEIIEKIVRTNIEKYGARYYNMTSEHQDRVRKTSLKKYGVEHPVQSEEVKNKMRETNIIRYGVPNAAQNKEINAKIRNTLYKNGTAPVSKQQKWINSLVNGVLNYPLDNCSLDIALIDEKIAIEYDGGGHDLSVTLGTDTREDFIKKERRRDYYVMSKGWKVIRISSSKDYLPPSDELKNIIFDCISYLKNGRRWIKIDIDNELVTSSQFQKEIGFTKLRQMR